MDTLGELFTRISGLAIYQHGWLLFSILAIVPAIVSGNLVQHYLSKIITRATPFSETIKPLAFNLMILLISVAVMCYGFLWR